jgi:hypothetical protein
LSSSNAVPQETASEGTKRKETPPSKVTQLEGDGSSSTTNASQGKKNGLE